MPLNQNDFNRVLSNHTQSTAELTLSGISINLSGWMFQPRDGKYSMYGHAGGADILTFEWEAVTSYEVDAGHLYFTLKPISALTHLTQCSDPS